ncbi:MAG: hypothetical protein E6Q71_02335 [Pseudomonas sp.]|nr:MAG: hypothetical protein E6Q71_02335 [Pseudomonas sp.]
MIALIDKLHEKMQSAASLREKAERLYEQGLVQEALAVLTRLNRRQPDIDIEQRLVQMRHQGFFRLKHSSTLQSWPRTLASSPYPAGEIPSIPRALLTPQAMVDGIIGHGSLIVRNLLSPEDCRALIRAVDASIEAYDARPESDPAWFTPLQPCEENGEQKVARGWIRQGGGALAADSPRGLFQLLEVLGEAGVITLLADYLGERPALSVKKTTLRRVQPDTSSGWHQDGAFLGSNIRTVNLWIALTDCGVDAPSMDMVPVRLPAIVTTGTGKADFSWSLDDEAVLNAAGEAPPVRLQFKAGDAIFFDELNLHRTAASPGMTQTRYAIEAWFFAPSHYPLNQLPILA